jgi:hypothetical protein
VRRSGSSIWRARKCAASWALPQIDTDSEPSDAGRILHRFLEVMGGAIGAGTPATDARRLALEDAPPFARLALVDLDVARIDRLLGLTPELALAFDVQTGEGRVLGAGLARRYDGLASPHEFAMTIDLGGAAGDVGVVLDFKRGWSFRAHPRENDQMLSSALALSRALGLSRVHSWIAVWRDEDHDPVVMRATYDAATLDAYAADVSATWVRADEVRAALDAGDPPPHVVAGEWCTWCPARVYCPATTGLIRTALDLPFASEEDGQPIAINPARAGDLLRVIRANKATLNALETKIHALATVVPIPLGEDADTGRKRWLGMVTCEGNDKIDGDVAFEVLRTRYGDVAAGEAVKLATTKKAVEAVAKAHAAPRQKGKDAEAIVEAIRAAGGIDAPIKPRLVEYTTASDDPTDNPQPE